jgi:hypothetical protein
VVGISSTMHWNPSDTVQLPDDPAARVDPAAALLHELSHSLDAARGIRTGDRENDSTGISDDEVRATRDENVYRAKKKLTQRTKYGGKSLPDDAISTTEPARPATPARPGGELTPGGSRDGPGDGGTPGGDTTGGDMTGGDTTGGGTTGSDTTGGGTTGGGTTGGGTTGGGTTGGGTTGGGTTGGETTGGGTTGGGGP